MKNFTLTKIALLFLAFSTLPSVGFAQISLNKETFNSTLGIWTGTSTVALSATTTYEGNNSVRFKGTANQTLTSSAINISGYDKIDVKFFMKASSLNGEKMTVRYRQSTTAAWDTIRVLTTGSTNNPKDVNNTTAFHAFYATMLSSKFTFTATAQFQFIATLANDTRYFYLDNLSIIGTKFKTVTKGPGGVFTNLETWLRADQLNGYRTVADNVKVNTWKDVAKGNNANVIDSISTVFTNRPVYNNNASYNINFNPVVSFNNNPSSTLRDFTGIQNKAELNGTSGFYTNEQYIVVINDNPEIVSSTTPSIDLFCAQAQNSNPYSDDATGFGLGGFTVRFDSEVVSYCLGSTATGGTSVAPELRGYGVSLQGTAATVAHLPKILSARNNTAINGQELYANASRIDNMEVGVPQFVNSSNSRFWLGRSQIFSGSFGGRIAEVITYSLRKNETTEKRRIESYLAVKYGITLGQNGISMDYQNSNGAVIWNATANTGFNYNIAGIGRDDSSMLYQKQSRSVNTPNDITMALGSLSSTNSANQNTIGDDDTYLIWGNNNGTLNAQPEISVNMSSSIAPALQTKVNFISIGRTWEVVETGGDVPTVTVSIPAEMLTATLSPPGDYLMFISNSPVFDPSAEYRVMKANGTDLETTYNFNGTKYITFGYAPEKTFERAITFDGTDDYLDAGNVLDLAPSFTVSSWIKRTGADQSILSKRDLNFTVGYDLKINAAGNLEMSWINGTKQTITSSVVIPTEIWHNIAVTFNGTTAKMYIDGLEDTAVSQSLATVPANTQSFLVAAANGTAPTSFFAGTIDEVRVWNLALTAAQLQYIMNQEIVKFTDNTVNGSIIPQSITANDVKSIPWANLQAYYPMSTYTYTNIKDQSDNNFTAAIKNLTTVDTQTAPLPYISQADGPWNTVTTWKNNSVQEIPYKRSIINNNIRITWNIVQTNHNIESTGNKVLLGLSVNTNTITAKTDSKIEVTHYLKLNGKIDLQGMSQLIQTANSDLDVTSTGVIEKDQQGTTNIFNYNYWTSPVGATSTTSNNTAFTVDGILKDGTDPDNIKNINWVTGYDGSAGDPISLAGYWIYKFQNIDNEYANWSSVGATGLLQAGEGFTLKGSGAANGFQNYTFIGKPNNGQITLPIGAGFINLTGNPYASAIDATAFIDDNINAIDGTIYYWEHYNTNNSHNLSEYQGGYATYTKTGGLKSVSPPYVSGQGSSERTPKQYIPAGQGFFVTGSATGGTITFKNSQRAFIKENTTLNGVEISNPMFRTANNTTNAAITGDDDNSNDIPTQPVAFSKIRLGFNSANNYHRQILMGFMNELATSNIDPGYDALLFDDFPNDMYFLNGDVKLVIQGEGVFNPNTSYRLGVKTGQEGNVQFMVDELLDFEPGQKVYIYDATTELYHDITTEMFEINLPVGLFEERFSLRFVNSALGTGDFTDNNALDIKFTNNNNTLNIKNSANDVVVDSVIVFNMLGQSLQTWDVKNENQQFIQVPVENLSTGTYIVKLQTSAGPISKKIVIK